MRIIAGKFKGRHLKAVSGSSTRPTGDKIKEAVFHRIGPFFEGGSCLDLFAGSGSLGMEAISRGMDKAIFVDHTNSAIRTIHKNIQLLQIEQQCEVYRNDAFRAIQLMGKRNIGFDLILLDPPYDKMNYGKLLNELEKQHLANDNCMIYLEHRPEEEIPFNNNYFKMVTEKKYSTTTCITILQAI